MPRSRVTLAPGVLVPRTATTTTVARYIAGAEPVARRALRQLHAAIRQAAPDITERISDRIPTFDLNGQYLLYIAAFRDHVSVYPVSRGPARAR
ncbi:MAG: DUF1801 domain-containing protein [Acidimicrobiia bacterium]|nr:DUF1801 domain-containing protein [Acidimicrobiia bacterium]